MMSSQLKHIQDVAEKALNSVGVKTAPVPVEAVAEKFGLKVVEFAFPNSISGVLKKDRGVIGVNKGNKKVRQRFTIAHELGHFLLGHDIDKDEAVVDIDSNRLSDKEREANVFASHLLMPTEVVKEVQKHETNLKKLAELFDVSEQAITIRLLELNLIK